MAEGGSKTGLPAILLDENGVPLPGQNYIIIKKRVKLRRKKPRSQDQERLASSTTDGEYSSTRGVTRGSEHIGGVSDLSIAEEKTPYEIGKKSTSTAKGTSSATAPKQIFYTKQSSDVPWDMMGSTTDNQKYVYVHKTPRPPQLSPREQIRRARMKHLSKRDWAELTTDERYELLKMKHSSVEDWVEGGPAVTVEYQPFELETCAQLSSVLSDVESKFPKESKRKSAGLTDSQQPATSDRETDVLKQFPKARYVKILKRNRGSKQAVHFKILLPEELAAAYEPDKAVMALMEEFQLVAPPYGSRREGWIDGMMCTYNDSLDNSMHYPSPLKKAESSVGSPSETQSGTQSTGENLTAPSGSYQGLRWTFVSQTDHQYTKLDMEEAEQIATTNHILLDQQPADDTYFLYAGEEAWGTGVQTQQPSQGIAFYEDANEPILVDPPPIIQPDLDFDNRVITKSATSVQKSSTRIADVIDEIASKERAESYVEGPGIWDQLERVEDQDVVSAYRTDERVDVFGPEVIHVTPSTRSSQGSLQSQSTSRGLKHTSDDRVVSSEEKAIPSVQSPTTVKAGQLVENVITSAKQTTDQQQAHTQQQSETQQQPETQQESDTRQKSDNHDINESVPPTVLTQPYESVMTNYPTRDGASMDTPLTIGTPHTAGTSHNTDEPMGTISKIPTNEFNVFEDPTNGQQVSEHTNNEVSVSEKRASGLPVSEEPASEHHTSGELDNEQQISEEPTNEQQVSDKPSNKPKVTDVPANEQQVTKVPANEQQVTEEPANEQQVTEEPADEQQVTEEAANEQQVLDKPANEQVLDEMTNGLSQSSEMSKMPAGLPIPDVPTESLPEPEVAVNEQPNNEHPVTESQPEQSELNSSEYELAVSQVPSEEKPV